ncbi:MAG: lysophospholipid acyltransferase family protein [Winkia neuii]|uniref:1-acyl-sn-glycerol-3-phosphate acyltransferase n=1 Tax=Winkia neuii TaxID=33007 RepID=A0A2I1ILW6_9ACTO|nr:lysophospholipid acyltransferase family protein [Winkia neuii]OFJ70771.1 hypothetical protein HMPREF2851_09190 [Actinomyces sp. HMSC064C12]OFK02520.1 hypothetical protein HMPREF2835_06460 [Actinomyces sp. HMSC072A03]OFT53833.1 hypothetical protein HMPREF3152_10700 [Actinomyces sp. HMSC06A08]KWZ74897.1 Acyltransferase [Winkia neuii]MDK8099251.1 lysophospholipid acyltransferase family protein [Winkia neuii]
MAQLFSGGVRRALARIVVALCRVHLCADSARPDQFSSPTIFYANHTSHLDFLVLWAMLPLRERIRPVAAKDYWSSFPRALPARLFHAYLVDRSGKRKKNQIKGMNEVLTRGESLLIFPEGTRGDGRALGHFHRGIYLLAKQNPQVPVVPVRLQDLGKILPKGHHLPLPHKSSVCFCSPLSLRPGESQISFLRRARAALLPTSGS